MKVAKPVPKSVAEKVKELKLKRGHHALVMLLDDVNFYVEVHSTSSNRFLDAIIKWRRNELPALVKANVQFYIATGTAEGPAIITNENFPSKKNA